MANQLSDEQLVINYLKGDKQALEILFGRHLKSVYNFIYRYVNSRQAAEDIAQEAFVKAWRNLKKFKTKKKFKTWIFAIAKNSAIDFLRKKKEISFSDFESSEGKNILVETLANSAPLPDEILERKDIAAVVSEALGKLSPVQRAVLFLRFNENFNFREIAEALDEPLDTVKSRHRRALMLMRKILNEGENAPK